MAENAVYDWKTGFYGAVARFVESKTGLPDVTVLDFEDATETVEHGYCDTCAYSETVYKVEVYYEVPDDKPRTKWQGRRYYTYEGSFSQLINELVVA